MKKAWSITIVTLSGVSYFLISLWLHDPFSSKATTPISMETLELFDVLDSSESIETSLDDDSILQQEEELESTFQAAIKDSRLMQASYIVEQKSAHSKTINSTVASPWKAIDKSILTEDVRLRKGVEPLQVVQVDSNMLKSMKKGDQFILPVFNDRQYRVTVSKTKTLWNGDDSLQGTLQADDGNTFPVIISSGKSTTFASFSTPEGSFELEVFGGVGGLYSVNEMDKQAFYPKTDELLN